MKLMIDTKFKKGDFTLDVDTSIPLSGITAIFGNSGCGKTTLLRTIAGLEDTTGQITIGDKIWLNKKVCVPTHQRNLGYIFQEANLFPHLSVKKNLLFGFKRTPNADQYFQFEEIVDMFKLNSLLNRSTDNLSGGERQKIAIARSLLSNPKLILMDEPLSALDSDSKKEILDILENHQKKLNIPIIYVSHSKEEIVRIAQQIILMEDGKIIASGPTDQILTRADLPFFHSKDAEVIIEASVEDWDSELAIQNLKFSGGVFQIPADQAVNGENARIKVSARDVSLCLSHHADSSVLNIFPATIEDINFENSSQVTVKLDLKGSKILSRVSRKSIKRLEITTGMNIFAQIKGVALLN